MSERVRTFAETLAPDEQKEFRRAIEILLEDARPDGRSKVEVGFPYRPGTLVMGTDRFLVTYTFINPATVLVIDVARRAERPSS